jgi:hypothetical protein
MSNTTTAADLDRTFVAYVEVVKEVGGVPDGAQLIMTSGSRTNGRPFHIYLTGDGTLPAEYNSGHYRPLIGSSTIGWTKTEADNTLRAAIKIMLDTQSMTR